MLLVDNSLRLLFLLNMADILLTKYLTDLGAIELNPIVDYLLSVNFLWALLFKVAISITFILIVIWLRDQIRSMRQVVFGANIFLSLLVLYQLVGIVLLS